MPGKRPHDFSSIDTDGEFLGQDNFYLSVPASASEHKTITRQFALQFAFGISRDWLAPSPSGRGLG